MSKLYLWTFRFDDYDLAIELSEEDSALVEKKIDCQESAIFWLDQGEHSYYVNLAKVKCVVRSIKEEFSKIE